MRALCGWMFSGSCGGGWREKCCGVIEVVRLNIVVRLIADQRQARVRGKKEKLWTKKEEKDNRRNESKENR